MDIQVTHMYQRNSDDQGPDRRQDSHNPSNGNNANGNDPRKKGTSPLRVFLFIIALISVLAAGSLFLNGQGSNMNGQPVVELPYSSFYQQVMNGNIKDAIFQGQDITGDFKNPISLTGSNGIPGLANQYHLTQIPNGDPNLIPLLNTYHVQYQAKPVADHNALLNILFSFLPLIVVFGVIFFISRRATQSQQNVFSFGKTRAKVVLGDRLDTALLRPGRFDRRVVVERPDWNGRLAILKIHSRGVPLAQDVDLITIARATPGMVGADIANLVNEAALLAARRNLGAVTQNCFDDALDKILIGAERPLALSEADLNVIAYHESGHALTGLLQEDVDPVTKVTIVPRGQALGVTQYTPLDDRYNYSKEYLEAQLVTALGGRAAEQVAIGHITTGAENDLQRVTAIARQMVTHWGMSERLGTISFSERDDPFAGTAGAPGSREYSEQTASIIDEEVNRIVKSAYDRAIALLTTHRETLNGIARSLRLHETLDSKQLHAIIEDTSAVHSGPL